MAFKKTIVIRIFYRFLLINIYLYLIYFHSVNHYPKTVATIYLIDCHILSHATVTLSPPRRLSRQTQRRLPPQANKGTSCWTSTRPTRPPPRPPSTRRSRAKSRGHSLHGSLSTRGKRRRRSRTQSLSSKTRLTFSLATTTTRRVPRPQPPPGETRDRSWAAHPITRSSLPQPKGLLHIS